MYNMGHLLTAACIHYRSTGKRILWILHERMQTSFTINGKLNRFIWPGIPGIHLFLWEWQKCIVLPMNPKYLELLQIMIDNRGSRPNPDRDHRYGGTDQTQDRVPLRERIRGRWSCGYRKLFLLWCR